jgi:hypothetical protein
MRLAREPCVGVADNVDFWRVARPAGIEVSTRAGGVQHVVCSFPTAETDLTRHFSSAAVIAAAARRITWDFDPAPGSFDLRQLGLLYWLAATAVIAGSVAAGLRIWLAVLTAWVLVDPGFLLFFNSLYADSALILGLLGVVSLLAAEPRTGIPAGDTRARPVLLALVALLTAVAGLSKMQYSTFPLVLLATLLLALLLRRRAPARSEAILLVILAALAVAAPWHFLRGSGPRFLAANNYNAVFGGIAKAASAPDSALAKLGIPAEHRSGLPGSYFSAGAAARDAVLPHLRDLSRLRLAALYFGDPRALLGAASRIDVTLWRVRTHPRHTTTREESVLGAHRPSGPEQFSLWRDRLLGWLPAGRTWALLALTGAVLALQAWRRRWTCRESVWLFLLLWVVSQMAMAVLGEGFVNLHQHLLGARLGFDLLLASLLGWGIASLAGRARFSPTPTPPPAA